MDAVRFNENMMISPTCTICEEIFHTKAYGSDLEICPRCKSLGMRYLKELEILKLQYESQQRKIREKFKREVQEGSFKSLRGGAINGKAAG